jgi:hypothetical protein
MTGAEAAWQGYSKVPGKQLACVITAGDGGLRPARS